MTDEQPQEKYVYREPGQIPAQTPPPTKVLTDFTKKFKSKIPAISKKKVITLAIVLLFLLTAVLAINLLAQKQQDQAPPAPRQITADEPSPSENPSNAEIAKRVGELTAKLDNMIDYGKKVQYPIVDLAISFDK